MKTYTLPDPSKRRQERREEARQGWDTAEHRAIVHELTAARRAAALLEAAKKAPKPKVLPPLKPESFDRRVNRLTRAFEKQVKEVAKDLGVPVEEADVFAYDLWPNVEVMEKRPDVQIGRAHV